MDREAISIVDVLYEPVRTGFFRDDQAAIRSGRAQDGFVYEGEPITPGFRAIRQAGEAVSVMLILSDGQVAVGDCAEVQYSGAGGRAPLVQMDQLIAQIREHVAPLLKGRAVSQFRPLAEEMDAMVTPEAEPLFTAVRYGVTQALLQATALASRLTMAEVVQREYDIQTDLCSVPIYAQSGDERYLGADKMILKQVDVLPHALINQVESKLGADGELLRQYILWLSARILQLRTRSDYDPRIHIDTYGTIGLIFDNDVDRVAEYLSTLADAAEPFRLRVEHPLDAGSRDDQIRAYVRLRAALATREARVELVVDEWCNTLSDIHEFVAAGAADVIHVKTPDLGGVNNTIEALLYVRRNNLSAYCGGTCNETDISAKVCTHIAMACAADQVLAKPGMGIDEGLMIVGNEMVRTMALARERSQPNSTVEGRP